ncbi:hypothetical protein A2334_05495 [Candidatus Roizmanbacteria bacterium RIFOXYB2_FULL_38_10]|uniref:4Fe-4S ferredoxin-type domain-containing protein n=1 Tax=Candidatus Roizmanbacteria bacterium RIFOXYD1_FULL_38_12 TaxID=1802093 RepID=A0A1F7L0S8_9BACT|nr:MAG: hypothetical protein A3K47_02615 [Candidatus Roizmanbacteria bacterium RIFOXYA2_FULL_38_14]OGK63661.1 MAG: hypothetical protein A3K27_02615 [Candidatus Roizmanbacteria bacterium RIFOXYA1_FULL_37_12]OGK65507.1 MAG: hypothetical protein A3K38_02615 [Candidatus Roizmanbacteria bacterium RIFOXYB1_FULL_40_23]OGK68291.1 MAG: hypothetical protein A2334_05495 [Candidatus Roizmanbacteria bacterium RIFOXYB2_FULL_38_10]OGK69912.1 MAG: hypothetical protein A3K21_02620 [Candidatus Roizmanbacteria ba
MERQKKNSGFTLIELLVVISFILLFSGYSVGYYNQYTEQKKLENTGKKIANILSLARAKTIAGDSSMCGGVGAEIASYSIEILSSSEYSLQPNCSAGSPSPIVYKTETNIVFPTPVLSVSFFPITGGAKCDYIYIKNTALSGSGVCRYTKVSSTGLISEDACSACDACPSICP